MPENRPGCFISVNRRLLELQRRRDIRLLKWEARTPNSEVGGKQSAGGELKVVTTGLTPGYYFKHGVPYSGNAVLTEYFARLADGPVNYLMVSTVVDDPQYLTQPFAKTLVFKHEADGSKWNPAPCSVP
jgi:hypothetical protein